METERTYEHFLLDNPCSHVRFSGESIETPKVWNAVILGSGVGKLHTLSELFHLLGFCRC